VGSINAILELLADGGTLRLASTDQQTMSESTLYSEDVAADRSVSLSPGGRRLLLFTSAAGSSVPFTVIDLPELRSRLVSAPPVMVDSGIAWTPDQRSVFFFGPPGPSGPGSRPLWRFSLEDGAAVSLGRVSLPGLSHPVAVHPYGRHIAVTAMTTIAEYWATESMLSALRAKH
jgi:hypothetical protein